MGTPDTALRPGRTTTVTVTIEVPEIVAGVLEGALDESVTALIVPDSIFPGFQGRIIKEKP